MEKYVENIDGPEPVPLEEQARLFHQVRLREKRRESQDGGGDNEGGIGDVFQKRKRHG